MSIAQNFNLDLGVMGVKEVDDFMVKYQRYSTVKEKAKLKAEEEFYLKKERMKIQLGLNKDIPDFEIKESKELEEQVKEQKKEKDPKYGVFITVNPKVNTLEGFKDLDEKVRKCISKCWVTDFCYCYEQRSDDKNDIKGLHTHILLKRGIKPSHTEREIRSCFKTLVGIPSKHIDIRYKQKDWFYDKIFYMSGNKTGEGKMEKTIVDTHMRQLLEIEKLYSSENFFLKYGTNGEN